MQNLKTKLPQPSALLANHTDRLVEPFSIEKYSLTGSIKSR
jgi:hypothetical protein